MAEDNNFKDLVKSMKANTEMATHNNDAIRDLNKTFSDYFTMLSRQTKDQEENSREAKKSTRVAKSSPKDHFGLGKNNMNFIGGFAGIGKTIALVTAGVTSFGLAFAGLRGWELPALKAFSQFVRVPEVISNGMLRLRNAALGVFGLNAAGLQIRGADGRFGVKTTLSVSEQIGEKIRSLRTSALALFGLGADGGPPKPTNLVGRGARAGGTTIGFITTQIGKLLKPLTDVGAGISKFIAGTGADVFASIAKFGGSAAAWLGIVGKIFKPIAIIFSLKAAFDKFMETDGDLLDKTSAGISGFFSDFLGAPLDLLKRLVARVFTALGWDSAAKTLNNISITDALFKTFESILNIPIGLFRFFKSLFLSPKEAFAGLLDGIIDITQPFRDLFNWFEKTVSEWGNKQLNKVRAIFGFDPIAMQTEDDVNRLAMETAKATILNKQFDRNQDGFLSYKEIRDAGTGRSAEKLMQAIALGGSDTLKDRYSQYIDAATNVGDTINIHKYQGPALPAISATRARDMNEQWQALMQ